MREEEHLSQDRIKKKRCCEQSFLGQIVGLPTDTENRKPPSAFRRFIGLFLLAGVHIQLMLWSGLMSIFTPRYRRVFRFQWRYFKDVMANELRQNNLSA